MGTKSEEFYFEAVFDEMEYLYQSMTNQHPFVFVQGMIYVLTITDTITNEEAGILEAENKRLYNNSFK